MTGIPDTFPEETSESDIRDIRIEQAKMLNQMAVSSCRTVEVIILIIAAAIWASGYPRHALIWVICATLMVGIVFWYAWRTQVSDITAQTYKAYLTGHTIISGMTGLVWSGFACYHIDWDKPFTVIIAGTMTMIISVGGMLPTAIYRREYIVLASCALLPFSLFTLLTAPGPMRLFGLATLTYFALCMGSSAQAEINTRDGILARRTKKLTARLIEQNEIITKASREKTRFLAATSHDLSQPLHAQGYFIQALRATLTEKHQVDLLDKVESSWRSQRDLLQGIVDITRLDSGAIIPKKTMFDLKGELEKLVGEFEGIARSNDIQIKANFKSVFVRSDPILLMRIFRNLLSNAVKFTPDKGEINIDLRQVDDVAEIHIRDTGAGIPAERQDDVFQEYVQLDDVHNPQSKGLGLGLSIVRRLVKLLGIDLELISSRAQGTEFRLVLPVSQAEYTQNGTNVTDVTKLPMSPLIVVVDDEKAIREGMTALLTDWGCQTIAARNSAQAINLLSVTSETPHALIVDKRLGDGDNGLHLIQVLREEVNEAIPAILMTGDLAGFGDIIPESDIRLMPKPVDPDALKQALKDILGA